jgi:hypothetical protein
VLLLCTGWESLPKYINLNRTTQDAAMCETAKTSVCYRVPSVATSEARGGECFDERSGWMVSIVFTPRGGDEKNKTRR